MAFRADAPDLPLALLRWDETGTETNPKSRLLAHMRIGGLDMHLEAIEVTVVDGHLQEAAESEFEDRFEALVAIEETAFETITINEREYVLFAVPYGV